MFLSWLQRTEDACGHEVVRANQLKEDCKTSRRAQLQLTTFNVSLTSEAPDKKIFHRLLRYLGQKCMRLQSEENLTTMTFDWVPIKTTTFGGVGRGAHK